MNFKGHIMKTTFKISKLISIILSSNLLSFDPLDQVIIDDMNNFDVHLDENKVDWVDFLFLQGIKLM